VSQSVADLLRCRQGRTLEFFLQQAKLLRLPDRLYSVLHAQFGKQAVVRREALSQIPAHKSDERVGGEEITKLGEETRSELGTPTSLIKLPPPLALPEQFDHHHEN
jgi:hypothetical protein